MRTLIAAVAVAAVLTVTFVGCKKQAPPPARPTQEEPEDAPRPPQPPRPPAPPE